MLHSNDSKKLIILIAKRSKVKCLRIIKRKRKWEHKATMYKERNFREIKCTRELLCKVEHGKAETSKIEVIHNILKVYMDTFLGTNLHFCFIINFTIKFNKGTRANWIDFLLFSFQVIFEAASGYVKVIIKT